MAKTTVTQFTSDLTGNPIEGDAAEIRIKVDGKMYVGDAGASEVADLIARFEERKVPGRRKKDDAEPSEQGEQGELAPETTPAQ